MTFNIGGSLASGFSQGLDIGNRITDLMKEDAVAKVRAQGIAEARAMQAAGTPQVQDNGDMQNLTANPQASVDPAAPPVNTSLAASPAMAGAAAPVTADPDAPLSDTPQASPAPAGPATGGVTIAGGKRFMVGDQGFDDLASAQAHAAKQAPDINEMMRKTLVPKMQAIYMDQGDVAKADAWGQWAKSKEGEQKMADWGKAFSQAQAGNFGAAADQLAKMHADLNDGMTYLGHEDVKDKNGNLTGFNMTYKDDATGEQKSQFVDKHALIDQGLTALSPQAMFDQTYKAQAASDTMAAKEAIDNRNDARTAARQAANAAAVTAREGVLQDKKFSQDKEMEAVKSTNRIAEDAAKKQIDVGAVGPTYKAKLDAQVAAMRQYGMSEDDIQGSIPVLVGADGTKKTTDPTERRAIITTELLKDPRFGKKTEAQQKDQVDQLMRVGGVDVSGGVKIPRRTNGTPPPAAPAAGATPPAGARVAKTGGIPVWDPATNSMITR
jgi:hypothetical protein